ncbi:SurA N-terminal domain-containing protein [Wolbachia endosymbiont of Diaphorina citri]|jgi:SurA N-terminal domain.|uniref:SurA N-terminal domain-containing protein n=1 Tax=Wolbachia endosymbiont of Diaphorina citri TaxID=116598 RepID=UPI00031A1CB6|nr:SurA N-terminal domain-containing protein [Wolbachia endosymbiont of Diaphorina citri]QJT94466.1 SurA N-terminal domain-containing protein [Wolbachia endosymbiont of Diaphorina citri]QJT95707.1 SurA N-terminal domain-containing protein [Wolbachia endosymbiont of Diaphorina citri]QJT97069.1 SurA N-terminal domain-containing protein [Wolbachia endosymbiont of Diaphorina citri]QLK11364.1 peptidylprolyl isomerase [Wolbachia endosymbiont of Diaphorina citri]QXY87103.1 peptidylprolyl isomerase [W
MHKILILILIMLPLRLLATEIEIVADVNGEPISNLDIERRINFINSLLGTQKINQKEVKSQILRQLIDEIIIVSEAQKMNIELSNEELNNAVTLFLTQSLKLKADEVDQYVKKHNIDLNTLKKQVKCQLLWNKIIEVGVVPLINISDQEVDDARKQKEKSDYLITFQEFIIPDQKIAEDLVKKLRTSNNPESSIKMRKATVNLSQLKGTLKDVLERLEISDVAGPISLSEGYSVIKVIDKVQLDHTLLESILKVKQVMVKASENLLSNFKEQKVSCLNVDKLADDFKLPSVKEFKVKMRDLNPDLQILFSKTSTNEIVELRENSTAKLMMLCDIKNNAMDIEAIKQEMYQQKIMIQSNLLLDNMRKNAAVSYRFN